MIEEIKFNENETITLRNCVGGNAFYICKAGNNHYLLGNTQEGGFNIIWINENEIERFDRTKEGNTELSLKSASAKIYTKIKDIPYERVKKFVMINKSRLPTN